MKKILYSPFQQLSKAFPKSLADDVAALEKAVFEKTIESHRHMECVQTSINTENIYLPYRLYFDKKQVIPYCNREITKGKIALCIGSRHYDGTLRQTCIKQLLKETIKQDEIWLIPYILHVASEYVLPILIDIFNALKKQNDLSLYHDFINQNPIFFNLMKARIISYWNEYHRSTYRKLKNYPGYEFIQILTTRKIN